MSNLIKDLDKKIQPAANKAYKAMNNSTKLKNMGVEKIIIVETKRELAVQMAYYSRSRMKDNKFYPKEDWLQDGNYIQGYHHCHLSPHRIRHTRLFSDHKRSWR